jgi:hypothetical protein
MGGRLGRPFFVFAEVADLHLLVFRAGNGVAPVRSRSACAGSLLEIGIKRLGSPL